MNVVPDLLPSLHPSFDLRITFPQPNVASKAGRSKRIYTAVEPGSFLLPEQVCSFWLCFPWVTVLRANSRDRLGVLLGYMLPYSTPIPDITRWCWLTLV